MQRVMCCALGVVMSLLTGCSHTTPIAKSRGTAIPPTTKIPNRADLTARIELVEAEAERAKQAGNNTAALQAYRRLVLLDPGHADAHHHLAVAADMELNFSAAEQHYRAALAREPENPHLHTSLGWSLFLQHRDGEALGELRRALELDPEHATALYNMGWLAAHRGDESEALEYFRRGGTEAQAQALLTKVRLELEDRTSRNEAQHAVARLRAPSPRGRPPRNEEPAADTVQARAEIEDAQPASKLRTVSLETEPVPVSESPEVSTLLDEESEPQPLPPTGDGPDLTTRHLAERPALVTVAPQTGTRETPLPDGVTEEAMVNELVTVLSNVVQDDLGNSLSETRSPTRQRPDPIASRPTRSPAAVRVAAHPTTALGSDASEMAGDAMSVDAALGRDEEAPVPTESWPAFSSRTLATVGRVMLGKPPASREPLAAPVREAPGSHAGVLGESDAAFGMRTAGPSRSGIEPELLNAARVGLNLGQPATRRFHSPSPAADELE
jgi:Tfp pilus assembly protein PilF